jgi:hypothetical protein
MKRAGLMDFKDIASRISGFSCPIFGVSRNPPELARTKARRVVRYMEDKHVLFNPYELEIPKHCVDSITEIRTYLTEELAPADIDSELAARLACMRASCRKFLDTLPFLLRYFCARMIAHPHLSPEIYGENYRFPLFWEMCPEITVIPRGLS